MQRQSDNTVTKPNKRIITSRVGMIIQICKYKSACLIEKNRNVVRTTFSPQ